MSELAAMVRGGIMDQLQGESLHLAFLALVGGVSAASAIIGWLIRRDIRRTDKESAERNLKLISIDEKLDHHITSSGYEIQDIHLRTCVMAAQIQRVIPEVDIPEWPTRK